MIIDNETGEIRTVFLRTPYNYDTDKSSDETGLSCPETTKTQQQFKDETDINQIVERFGVTGEFPPAINFPEQTEFMETFDYQTSMNVIVQAREAFMELPAKVRAKFDNEPQKFMEFFNDPDNQDAAIKMGIATDSRIKQIVEKKEEPKKDSEPPKPEA